MTNGRRIGEVEDGEGEGVEHPGTCEIDGGHLEGEGTDVVVVRRATEGSGLLIEGKPSRQRGSVQRDRRKGEPVASYQIGIHEAGGGNLKQEQGIFGCGLVFDGRDQHGGLINRCDREIKVLRRRKRGGFVELGGRHLDGDRAHIIMVWRTGETQGGWVEVQPCRQRGAVLLRCRHGQGITGIRILKGGGWHKKRPRFTGQRGLILHGGHTYRRVIDIGDVDGEGARGMETTDIGGCHLDGYGTHIRIEGRAMEGGGVAIKGQPNG